MDETRPRWSIAIMCFNESARLEEAVARVLAVMRARGESFEVVVVDDGSTDGSGAIADALAAKEREVRVVRHARNQGIGSVLIDGYRQTRGDVVAIIPADLQFAPEDLPAAMARMSDADVVSILRARRHDPWLRKVVSFVDRTLLFLLFGLRARDVHWVKLYRRAILEAVEIVSRTPIVDAELLVKSRRLGARMVDIELPHHARTTGVASGGRPGLVVKSFVELLKLRARI